MQLSAIHNRLRLAAAGLLVCTALQAQTYKYPYQNPALSATQRAEDLCRRLTLDEKAKLMMDRSPAIKRLGIPQFEWWNEALHGVGRNGYATVFPITMAMAASFDDALVHRVFTAVSDEARAKNAEARRTGSMERYRGLSFWTPNINIFRDPRWGRGQETYGEDPFLTAKMGLAVVHGLQGTTPESLNNPSTQALTPYRKLLACAKHFAVHSGPEWNRHTFNIENLPARDLWETYLPAFKALVKEGNVQEIMCAYQRIDGEPCCGNTRYLQQILRNEWGYQGLVTSDCGAISDFWREGAHGFSPTIQDAVARGVLTGTDLECGSDYQKLPEAVKAGKITEAQIDVSLRRLLKARFELGDFDPDELVEWTKIPMSVVASPAHKKLALTMARESITLLQNRNSLLPLNATGQRIVVMGPNANDSIMLRGNYEGTPTASVTLLQGIRQKAPGAVYVEGCGHLHNTRPIDEIVAHTANADIVIFAGGISPQLEGEEMPVAEEGFKGGDRTSIELPREQRELIAALHAAGKRIVFVNCSGSAVALVPESEYADAIVQAWYGGEQGGTAVADVLFGDYNPSGKLPVTFYKSTDQLPDYEDYRMQNRTYRYFRGEPLFPFGYGLSYTTFAFGKPHYDTANGIISIDISNTGNRDGEEVVQVYMRRLDDADGPLKTLRAFKRVSVSAGETCTAEIPFRYRDFENWDGQSNTMRVVPGRYELMIGNSSRDTDLQRFTVTVK